MIRRRTTTWKRKGETIRKLRGEEGKDGPYNERRKMRKD
jgi:hypothetical protein